MLQTTVLFLILCNLGLAQARDLSDNQYWVASRFGNIFRVNPDGVATAVRRTLTTLGAVAVDQEGNAYVADAQTGTAILKFAPDGSLIGQILIPNGSAGSIAIDREGSLWVVTGGPGKTLEKFDSMGNRLFVVDSTSAAMVTPNYLSIDALDRVWVSDFSANAVFCFSSEGTLLFQTRPEDVPCPRSLTSTRNGTTWVTSSCGGLETLVYDLDSQGSIRRRVSINAPRVGAVLIDSRQWLWATSPNTNQVFVWDSVGTFSNKLTLTGQPFGLSSDSWGNILVTHSGAGRLSRISYDPEAGAFSTTSFAIDSRNPLPVTGDFSGFHLASNTQPDGDFDGDGFTNEEEIDLGFNPFDPLSVPYRWIRGNVGTAVGAPQNVLFINDSAGDAFGKVRVLDHEPFSVFLNAPAGAPAPVKYVLFAYPRLDGPEDAMPTELPRGVGLFVGDYQQGFSFANTIGHRRYFGTPLLESSLAPTTILRLPRGFAGLGYHSRPFALQAIIQDPGSSHPAKISVSNAVFFRSR